MEDILKSVYDELGPGHRETVYQKALEVEFRLKGIPYECERVIPVIYKNHVISYMRMDMVVDGSTILELKAIKSLKDGDESQLRRYIKATGIPQGYVINFGGDHIEYKKVELCVQTS